MFNDQVGTFWQILWSILHCWHWIIKTLQKFNSQGICNFNLVFYFFLKQFILNQDAYTTIRKRKIVEQESCPALAHRWPLINSNMISFKSKHTLNWFKTYIQVITWSIRIQIGFSATSGASRLTNNKKILEQATACVPKSKHVSDINIGIH